MTQYTPIPGNDSIQVVAHTKSGETISLPTAKLKFRTERGFAAVRISLPDDAIAGIDAEKISVQVGAKVTLRPVPLPKYRRPHEPDEVAHAATTRRDIGDKVVDKGGVAREITVLTNQLVNALPEHGRVDKSSRHALWDKTFDRANLQSYSRSAVRQAERAYKRCLANVEKHQQETLRGCIWRSHDHQVWKLNHRYWNGLTGS